jgi:hypothetical protein
MPEQLYGDREALRLAWEEASGRDLEVLAESSGGSVCRTSGALVLKLMDRECAVDVPSRRMTYTDDGGDVKPHMQVLVLHYLLGSGAGEPTGNMVTFREFPGGALYYPAYRKRTLDRLLSRFGSDPDGLRSAGERLGAERVGNATVSFRASFFPKLPVEVYLWAGDEEVPASANVLFDECAGKMLSTEDVTVVAGAICSRLLALGKS